MAGKLRSKEDAGQDAHEDRQHNARGLPVLLWLAQYSLHDRSPGSHRDHEHRHQACWEPDQATLQWSATLLHERRLRRRDNGTIRSDRLMKTSEIPPGAS